jgi:hypothetical protein
MITNSKILVVALIAALVGGSLGAIAMRSTESSRQAAPVASTNGTVDTTQQPADQRDSKYNEATYNAASSQPVPNEFKTAEEQDAYKIGFADGFQAATERRNVGATRTAISSNNTSRSRSQRVYYDYSRKNGRTFWQKHRDKLTLAMGTGGGALVGGLIGGKKGAGIGALAGLGGSALYTYKIRKRTPQQ